MMSYIPQQIQVPIAISGFHILLMAGPDVLKLKTYVFGLFLTFSLFLDNRVQVLNNLKLF